MSTTILIIVVSIAAVAIFVLGMSLTLMIKGHHIKSEISENENMRRLGLNCVISEEATADGTCPPVCGAADCISCEEETKKASGHEQ